MANLGPLTDVNNFSQLLPIVEKAESKLSFFGNRYVCIGTEDDTIDFKVLVSYVNVVLDIRREIYSYERNYLKQITKLINRLYKTSDEQMANSNLFTWIANIFRECICKILRRRTYSGIRWRWKDCRSDLRLPKADRYKFYTPQEFFNKFWYTPDKSNEKLDFYEDSQFIWFRHRKDTSSPRIIRSKVPSDANMYSNATSTIDPRK